MSHTPRHCQYEYFSRLVGPVLAFIDDGIRGLRVKISPNLYWSVECPEIALKEF